MILTRGVYRFSDFVLYGEKYLLTHSGNPLSLPPRIFDTLLCLLNSAGTPVTKEMLMQIVWSGQHVSGTNVTRAISDLRSVLKDYAHNIKTIPGVGYCFVGEVERLNVNTSSRVTDTLLPFPAANAKSVRLISVLPFQSTVAESDFATRCKLETITELGCRTDLPVASPAVFHGNTSNTEDREASHFLMSYIYERPRGLSVYLHLSNVEGRIVWASRFFVPNSIDERPTYIARQIAKLLQNKLRQPTGRSSHADGKAMQLHGRALFHWRNRTRSSLRKGLKYAEAALLADESFPQAHVTVANYYTALVPYGDFKPSELLLKARASALRALELDPGMADAYVTLGIIKLRYEFDQDAAEECFGNSVALDPCSWTAWHWLGNVHCIRGHFKKAAETLHEAYELNPRSLSIRAALAQALFLGNDLERSREWLLEVLELNPTFALAEFGLGMVCGTAGDKKSAMRYLKLAAEHSGGRTFFVSSLAYGASRWGDRRAVRTILSHLMFRRGRRYVPYYDLGVTQLANGNPELALRSLRKGIAARDAIASWLGVDPRITELHGSTEFQQLLQQVGFRKSET